MNTASTTTELRVKVVCLKCARETDHEIAGEHEVSGRLPTVTNPPTAELSSLTHGPA